jgi:hypothetical protein
MQDPDLRALRERREWLDALEKAKGGVSTRALVGARAEARAPFRLARLFLFGGLGAGAAIGLFIITSRLVAALKGDSPLKRACGPVCACDVSHGPGRREMCRPLRQYLDNWAASYCRGLALRTPCPAPSVTHESSCAGGEGAPDLTETLKNFTINAAALALLSWLFVRDFQGSEKDKRIVDREEALGRLLVHRPCFTRPPVFSTRCALPAR